MKILDPPDIQVSVNEIQSHLLTVGSSVDFGIAEEAAVLTNVGDAEDITVVKAGQTFEKSRVVGADLESTTEEPLTCSQVMEGAVKKCGANSGTTDGIIAKGRESGSRL
ncbi:hypothetical protein PIB30_060937 [Stylosanthes scabra]|uniref:Uncharacterized protein n=1 Tax=Stylosanthes scabra TaxID=79078 RepID=A0ABU6UPB8_9FABA|nr:hypothetical protein [Stylosanthes scabra]